MSDIDKRAEKIFSLGDTMSYNNLTELLKDTRLDPFAKHFLICKYCLHNKNYQDIEDCPYRDALWVREHAKQRKHCIYYNTEERHMKLPNFFCGDPDMILEKVSL